jgi:hypothetical protein
MECSATSEMGPRRCIIAAHAVYREQPSVVFTTWSGRWCHCHVEPQRNFISLVSVDRKWSGDHFVALQLQICNRISRSESDVSSCQSRSPSRVAQPWYPGLTVLARTNGGAGRGHLPGSTVGWAQGRGIITPFVHDLALGTVWEKRQHHRMDPRWSTPCLISTGVADIGQSTPIGFNARRIRCVYQDTNHATRM